MYIRYNNMANQQKQNNEKPFSPPPPRQEEEKTPKSQTRDFKKLLNFLPKELYNPESHKFFGKLTAEDILLLGLILLVMDSDGDYILALALLYILLSDFLDFGNILSS